MTSPIFEFHSKLEGTMMLNFTIPGMTCGGCARSITKAIEGVDMLAKVETDIPARHVTVESSAAVASLIAAIKDAGYDARLN